MALATVSRKAAGSMPWQWAASLAGVACFYLTNDPARQLRTLALPGIVGPEGPDRFTPSEQDLLLRDGISTFDVGPDGTVTLIAKNQERRFRRNCPTRLCVFERDAGLVGGVLFCHPR